MGVVIFSGCAGEGVCGWGFIQEAFFMQVSFEQFIQQRRPILLGILSI